MNRIDLPAAVSGYHEDPLEHEWAVTDALVTADFTPAEQAAFLQAWDANEDTLTPQWRFLPDRYWDHVHGGGG